MPITLKKDEWKVKDPSSGNYRGAAILSTTLPEDAAQIIEDTQNALDAEEVRAGQIISDAQNSVDGIEAQSSLIQQKVANAVLNGNNYELIDTAVESWLDAHPEATTTVQDHSLTYEKLVIGTLNYVTPEMYGAVGDGVADDTIAVQNAINSGENVFLSKDYLINDNGIVVLEPNIYIFGNGRLLKSATDITSYKILYIKANNVIVDGLTIIGDRSNHIGITGESGHCIAISNNNITVKNCNLSNSWGDGIILNNYDNREISIDNTIINNCRINNCRRNGISVINATNFLIDNIIIENTNGTDPQAGIDVEPNHDYQYATGIINNVITKNNFNKGIQIFDQHGAIIKIKINNCTSYNDGNSDNQSAAYYFGLLRNSYQSETQIESRSIIESYNCSIYDCKYYGLQITNDSNIEGNVLVSNLSIYNSAKAAIKLFSRGITDTAIKKFQIRNYYCVNTPFEIEASNMKTILISSLNKEAVGTIIGINYVERVNFANIVSKYNFNLVNGDDNTVKIYTQDICQLEIIYRGTAATGYGHYLVNGYGKNTETIQKTIITELSKGSSQVSCVKQPNEDFITFTFNASGFLTIIDKNDCFKSIDI